MNHSLRLSTGLIAALFAAPITSAYADDTRVIPFSPTQEENAAERINFSGMLRMLSQRIPAAACHVDRGIEIATANALLEEATTTFEQILAALEFGDADLNINAAETRRKSLVRIHELRQKWDPFKAAADAVSAGTATEADINYLLTENMALLAAAQLLVEELVKQYANPNAATQASLMMVDISDRQRTLTQQMSKDTCIVGSVYETPDTLTTLEDTATLFETSLEALRFGMPAVGIGSPPTPEIEDGLETVLNDWTNVKPLITEVLDGGTLTTQEQTITFTSLNATMADMNAVVALYAGTARPNS
ncbi:PilJ/NarX-like methyl-accepting chemotaxis transducer [Yoonia maricola]|uniref:PilJ/NarX-like methyl-accepting chemotaxis transducer n=1 Tax=Yoonia maricola TaxID=420999 RepID=A0A2M8WNH6_9RHOB|nr:type IV pili methyl-accepting chemotaxis transducer N-terminal domain-containing protein [Yoonia maricola]PJI92485.1 PilJ/NarX-like methyl-accepting chemotaxis transducer [Yoonia maricola]